MQHPRPKSKGEMICHQITETQQAWGAGDAQGLHKEVEVTPT